MAFRKSARSATRVLVLTTLIVLVATTSAFASDGTFLREWGTGANSRPVAVAMDGSGNAYVVQIGAGFNRVEVFNSAGASVRTFGTAVSPRGVAVDSAGNAYVADYGSTAANGQYVRKYDSTGTLIATWSGFGRPDGLALDSVGNLYVAERGAGQIRKVDGATGATLATWNTGTGVDLNNPIDIAVDSAGNVYVTDRGNNRVRKLDSSGTVVATWTGFTAPDGIAVDSANNVYVVEYQLNRVRKFDNGGSVLLSLVPPTAYNGPRGIAVDASDNVYVTDMEAHRVVVFGTATPPVVTSSASSAWSLLALVLGGFGVLYLGRRRLTDRSA